MQLSKITQIFEFCYVLLSIGTHVRFCFDICKHNPHNKRVYKSKRIMRSQFLLQNHKGLRNQWFRNSLGRRPISKKLGLKTLLAIYFPPIDSLCSWHDLNKTNYVSHQSKDHTKTVQVELFWRNMNRYLYFTLFVNIEISSNIGSWYHYKH